MSLARASGILLHPTSLPGRFGRGDLGVITAAVETLRDDSGFPGMRVLQFAFCGDPKNADLPHNYHQNVVAYTARHDNDTTLGWWQGSSTRSAAEILKEREFSQRYLHTRGEEIHWDLMHAVQASVADTAIIPLQDVLRVGSDGRMNLPNSTEGNWSWRFAAQTLTENHAERLRDMAEICGRAPKDLRKSAATN